LGFIVHGTWTWDMDMDMDMGMDMGSGHVLRARVRVGLRACRVHEEGGHALLLHAAQRWLVERADEVVRVVERDELLDLVLGLGVAVRARARVRVIGCAA
jgi:hypothetical protein